jgi:hypothetical protein
MARRPRWGELATAAGGVGSAVDWWPAAGVEAHRVWKGGLKGRGGWWAGGVAVGSRRPGLVTEAAGMVDC